LYDFCRETGVPHRKTGKLVLAPTVDDEAGLNAIFENARAAGVGDLRLVSAGEVKKIEPGARPLPGLWSPNTGIVDSHSLMGALAAKALNRGAKIAYRTALEEIAPLPDGFLLGVQGGYRFEASLLVNAAGLGAETVAAMAGIDTLKAGWRIHPCKGSYFAYGGRSPVKTLVYPVPGSGAAGLGVHATLDLGDGLKFGPDVEYVLEEDYRVDPAKAEIFARQADLLIPGLDPGRFSPGMAGIRPKLQGPGEGFRDFVIERGAGLGLPRMVNLLGIESPGLTSSLAIAGEVERLVGEL
jgi:L-2-hydroxyglutarate oxidase LhgO